MLTSQRIAPRQGTPLRQAIYGLMVLCFVAPPNWAQNASTEAAPSVTEKLLTPVGSETGVWTRDQVATMGRIRDTTLADAYTYNELTYLSDSIGPRLTGSPQAAAAVQWVASEMRSLG